MSARRASTRLGDRLSSRERDRLSLPREYERLSWESRRFGDLLSFRAGDRLLPLLSDPGLADRLSDLREPRLKLLDWLRFIEMVQLRKAMNWQKNDERKGCRQTQQANDIHARTTTEGK